MSVTDLIKNPAVRSKLDELLPAQSRTRSVEPLVPLPPGGYPQRTGTAFDYAVRFELARCGVAVEREGWVAENAVELLPYVIARSIVPPRDANRIINRARERVAAAREFHRAYVRLRDVDAGGQRRLAGHVLKLARLDPIYRAGYVGEALFAHDDDPSIDEIMALLRVAKPVLDTWTSRTPVLLNPTFGRLSELVGGADADLIAGGALVDLKVSSKPAATREMWRQLVVYMMLADEARREGQQLPRIETLIVYGARYGRVHQLDADMVRSSAHYEAAKAWLLDFAASVAQRRAA